MIARVCILAAVVADCGYTVGLNPALAKFAGQQSVQTAPFDNKSMEADAAVIATRAADRAIAERGFTRGSTPSLSLTGIVESVTAIPAGSGNGRIEAKLRVALIDPAQGDKVIAKAFVVDAEVYVSGDDVEGSESSRRLATQRLLERMATTAIDRLAP